MRYRSLHNQIDSGIFIVRKKIIFWKSTDLNGNLLLMRYKYLSRKRESKRSKCSSDLTLEKTESFNKTLQKEQAYLQC